MVIKKTPAHKFLLLRIALVTSGGIIAIKILSTLLVYNFFTFDKYLAVVAVIFLTIGHFLSHRSENQNLQMETRIANQDEEVETLKAIRHSLTNREFLIFKFLVEGKTNKEIASILFVEVSTVKTHINNLYSKIKCKNRREAKEKWEGMSQKSLT